VHKVQAPYTPGVRTVVYASAMALSSPKMTTTVTFSIVVMGAGQIKSAAENIEHLGLPFPRRD
jgi:hypothetical protein